MTAKSKGPRAKSEASNYSPLALSPLTLCPYLFALGPSPFALRPLLFALFSAPLRIERTAHASTTLIQNMCVNHRGPNVFVAEQLLDGSNVVTVLQ